MCAVQYGSAVVFAGGHRVGNTQTSCAGEISPPSPSPTHFTSPARRQVKLARPEVVSYGALTTVTNYHLIPKSEHVVDSVFMHDNYARTPTGKDLVG